MKFLSFDIMIGDRYICTMHYRYCPAFAIDYQELKKFIEEKRPSLKNKQYSIHFDKSTTPKLKT